MGSVGRGQYMLLVWDEVLWKILRVNSSVPKPIFLGNFFCLIITYSEMAWAGLFGLCDRSGVRIIFWSSLRTSAPTVASLSLVCPMCLTELSPPLTYISVLTPALSRTSRHAD